MLYTYTDYYKEFKCLADKCTDTCCAGWQIVIDDDSIERYKSISDEHPFKGKLHDSIDWEEEVFKQDKCRRCAFLNKENLCDMYTALGEDSLCYTCSTYPRHIEEFEDVREVTLSLSCPEVARILMEKEEKTSFYAEETSEEEDYEEYEDFDDLMSRFSGCYFDDYFLDPISEEFEEEIDDWKDCTDLYNQLMSLPEERIEDFLWSINVIGLFGMVYDEMGC